MKRSRFRVLAVCLAAMSVVLSTAAAGAQVDPDWEVVASGLDNPRGIAVYEGTVYVAEAGTGGDVLADIPLGDSSGPMCVGHSGSITRINARGHVRQIIRNLPSATEAVNGECGGPFFGAGATGPQGVDVRERRISYSTGLGGNPNQRDVLASVLGGGEDFGTLTQLRGPRPRTVSLVDFEAANDPDGAGVDSNPYGVLRQEDRITVAVDAGGNSLVRRSRRGSINVLATFTPRCVAWPFGPNPIPPDRNPCGDQALFPAQAVPTDVTRHSDGDYLVTTLGGFPFAVGESLVYKIDEDFDGPALCSTLVPAQGCEVFASALTALIGIDVDDDGNVHVVQFADGGVLGAFSGAPGADAGSVQVFDEDGNFLRSVSGLTLPGGVAVDDDYAYMTNFSVFPGAGQVVRTSLPDDDGEEHEDED